MAKVVPVQLKEKGGPRRYRLGATLYERGQVYNVPPEVADRLLNHTNYFEIHVAVVPGSARGGRKRIDVDRYAVEGSPTKPRGSGAMTAKQKALAALNGEEPEGAADVEVEAPARRGRKPKTSGIVVEKGAARAKPMRTPAPASDRVEA